MRAQKRMTMTKQVQPRIIGHITGGKPGPTVVIFAGIHGNEPAGVIALEEVFEKLSGTDHSKLHGSFIAFRGNPPALLRKKRFLSQDLNRIWTERSIEQITGKDRETLTPEEGEVLQIGAQLERILNNFDGPFYFIDLHTTSSETIPFITVNDALINRKFARLFKVPTVLGIEEFLEGPLLSYINERGYLGMGFESGSHESEESIFNSTALIWLVLFHSGFMTEVDPVALKGHEEQLIRASKGNHHFYEITHREVITDEDDFKMLPGFRNFQRIKKGRSLARNHQEEIIADRSTLIFMPLYQEQGEEGFFYIRRIPDWVLRLSARIRFWNWHRWITLLPGVKWAGKDKEKILVDLRIARFFTRSFFHVLGYRNRSIQHDYLMITNRELKAKSDMYAHCTWYKE